MDKELEFGGECARLLSPERTARILGEKALQISRFPGRKGAMQMTSKPDVANEVEQLPRYVLRQEPTNTETVEGPASDGVPTQLTGRVYGYFPLDTRVVMTDWHSPASEEAAMRRRTNPVELKPEAVAGWVEPTVVAKQRFDRVGFVVYRKSAVDKLVAYLEERQKDTADRTVEAVKEHLGTETKKLLEKEVLEQLKAAVKEQLKADFDDRIDRMTQEIATLREQIRELTKT